MCQMRIWIECQNPNKDPKNNGCTAPEGVFKLDMKGVALAFKDESGADSCIIECPYCHYRFKVWLMNIPDNDRGYCSR
jgi:hypothetical protein